MLVEASALRPREVYDLLTSLIVPRPIAWVSTRDAAGHVNLAPFSYFTGLGSDPPMLTIGISDRKGGVRKDTLRIVEETGVFCVNLVEEADAARMNASSADLPPEVSEPALLGIEMVPTHVIPGMRVKSSRAAMECKRVDVHRYGDKVKVNLLVAEVLAFYVADEALAPGTTFAGADLLRPIARLQGNHYAKLGERFSLERPKG